METSRTVWAEHDVERFVAPGFVAEFVFRGLQIIDRGKHKEVVDLLFLRADKALLVSQKCQDDPASREGERLQRWARKSADSALRQLKGALRRVKTSDEIWCDHRRRGRVSFTGLPNVTHAIATIEVRERVQLQNDLALEHNGTPISYLSVNDFLNVYEQLRSVPEIVRYLDERRTLPSNVLLSLGAENVVFSYYLLNDGSLDGFSSLQEAERKLSLRQSEFRAVITAKRERDAFALQLEHIADQLAGRHAQYHIGLSQTVLERYEPTSERRKYLVMQDLIAGFALAERAELGRRFMDAIEQRRVQGGKGFTFMAALAPSHPDVVFIFGSFGETPEFSRDRLLSCFDPITRAAMAHFGRSKSFIVVDRDGKSYEAGYAERKSSISAEEIEAERRLFGHLRMTSMEIGIRPDRTAHEY